MKNFKLYALAALAVVLAALLILWPSKSAPAQTAAPAPAKPQKLPPAASVDEQNYRYLNNKIIALNKQLNTLRETIPLSGDKRAAAELYAKLEKLSHDNEMLRASNEEISMQLADTEQLVNREAKERYEQNLTKLNDELAFYKSDNDGLKVNLSEKENAIKNLNSLISTLSNQKQMDEFEHDKITRKMQKDLEAAQLKAEAGAKNNADLARENELLKQRVNSLSKLEVINQKLTSEQAKFNMQILELNKELATAKRKESDAQNQAKNATAELALENKKLLGKIDEANAQILKLAGQSEDLKAELESKKQAEKLADAANNELQQFKIQHEKERAASTAELARISGENQAALAKLSAQLSKENSQNAKLRDELNALNDQLGKLRLREKELSGDLANAQSKLTAANEQLNAAKKNEEHQKNLAHDYKEQLALLKKDKITLTSQINALNKEFLSYKNSDYDRGFKDQSELKDKLMKLSLRYDEQRAQNLALKDELANTSLEIKRSAEQISALKAELERSKSQGKNGQKAAARIAELEAANDKLLKELEAASASQLGRYSSQNSELAALKTELERTKNQLSAASAASSFANIRKVAQISCDDLKSGASKLPESCKLRLRELLAGYNASYFYELVPIINDGGFRSLSRLSESQMPKSEAERLTRLANYGLSKDRIAAAREFVRASVPGALVSVSTQSITSKDKKGFVLKIYK